jgi:hypothetical protein
MQEAREKYEIQTNCRHNCNKFNFLYNIVMYCKEFCEYNG